MVARRHKKYDVGEASNYVTRKQAMQKLQLNLKDFRRLCVLKGIHPREPRNRKRAQKGDMTKIKTMYHEKDVRFLLHEPIVWKFRDFKVFLKKLKKAYAKGNENAAERLKSNKPRYSLDHIVRERYPTFVDAIRDLEDCLCLCFLYATFPKSPRTPVEMVGLCRRLCIEFMHYVIESKSLRKVFVSIKGYYYQAEIMGQTVTWVVPHDFSYSQPQGVDFSLMTIFVEFYTTVLGFVLFRLYHNLNLQYPPTLSGTIQDFSTENEPDAVDDEVQKERVAALNQSLARTVIESDEIEIDTIDTGAEDPSKLEAARKEAEKAKNLQTLFKGLKFFLGREIPKEPLVFMIRCLGGQVSWDNTAAPGSTFNVEDTTVTHQVCDRPRDSVDMKHIERFYIQPQWVFDSINRREKLEVHKYFVGEPLPPHLSPFISEERRVGDYVPPEEKEMLGLNAKKDVLEQEKEAEESEEEVEEEESGEDQDGESGEEEEPGMEVEKEELKKMKEELKKMKVERGQPENINKDEVKEKLDKEEFRLREMMIKKKHKGLYKSMMKHRKKRVNESKQLERKRKRHDEEAAAGNAKPSKKPRQATPTKAAPAVQATPTQ